MDALQPSCLVQIIERFFFLQVSKWVKPPFPSVGGNTTNVTHYIMILHYVVTNNTMKYIIKLVI